MEIEVGEYIRTNNGEIAKVIYNATNEFCDKERLVLDRVVSVNNSEFIYRDDIVKHSKNIINLIGKDDYVNGTKVTNIDNYDGIYTIEWEYGNVYTTEIINDKFIKTILTHEQYEQNSYKIGE